MRTSYRGKKRAVNVEKNSYSNEATLNNRRIFYLYV